MGMAFAEAKAGQADSAMTRLEALMSMPSPATVASLRDLDFPRDFKNDPRFIAILERGDKVF